MKEVIKQTQVEQDIKTRICIFEMFNSDDDISIALIQRKCKVGYNSAYRTFENLVEDGLIKRGKKFGISKFV